MSSAEEARPAVSASRYRSLSSRGFSGERTTGFGTLGHKDYFGLADAELLVAVLIEDSAGIAAIDSILAIPGIDLVIEGPLICPSPLACQGSQCMSMFRPSFNMSPLAAKRPGCSSALSRALMARLRIGINRA